MTTHEAIARERTGSPVRILALGDSYTIGESVATTERWPERLTAALRARGVAAADPTIVARTGWTTDELSAGMDSADLRGPYDLVTLLIGVNDQYRGRSAGEYQPRFRALLDRAIALAGETRGRVLVISIPDWGPTPFAADRDRDAIAGEIDGFNEVNRDEAARAGVRYVDVTPASRRAAADPSLIATDGLHPSGAMYAEWLEAIAPAAVDCLSIGVLPASR